MDLQVIDEDGSDVYGQVAGFEILTPDVPFFISKEGILQNTEALDAKLHHNYILRWASDLVVGRDKASAKLGQVILS